jgi:hypothetical protein
MQRPEPRATVRSYFAASMRHFPGPSPFVRKMPPEEIERTGDATLRQVLQIVPPVFIHEALAARHALLHFLESGASAYRVRTRFDDQRRTPDAALAIQCSSIVIVFVGSRAYRPGPEEF